MSGGDPMMIEACGGLYEWFPHELGEPLDMHGQQVNITVVPA